MLATLITVGDEILIGQIVDTNSAWMAQELNKIGVQVNEIITTSDDKDSMISAFAKAESQSDIVLITGGLGPTKDDVTKLTLAEYFDDTLVTVERICVTEANDAWKQVTCAALLAVKDVQSDNDAVVPGLAGLTANLSSFTASVADSTRELVNDRDPPPRPPSGGVGLFRRRGGRCGRCARGPSPRRSCE